MFLFGGIVLPLETSELLQSYPETCYFRAVGTTFLVFASENITAFVSVERFLAIKYPFKHRQWFNTRLTITCITLIWLFSGILTFFPVYTARYGNIRKIYHCGIDWWNDRLTTLVLVIFENVFIFIILVYCNINIVKVVRKRPSVASFTSDAEHLRLQKERTVSAVVVTIIITYFICFMPYCSILYCSLITKQFNFSTSFVWIALLLIRFKLAAV